MERERIEEIRAIDKKINKLGLLLDSLRYGTVHIAIVDSDRRMREDFTHLVRDCMYLYEQKLTKQVRLKWLEAKDELERM